MSTKQNDGGRLALRPNFAMEYFEEGALVLNLDTAVMIRLNASGAAVLRGFASGCPRVQIEAWYSRHFEVDAAEAADAVLQVGRQLLAAGWPVQEAELRWRPQTLVDLGDPDSLQQLERLLDSLDGLDDVRSVNCNLAG